MKKILLILLSIIMLTINSFANNSVKYPFWIKEITAIVEKNKVTTIAIEFTENVKNEKLQKDLFSVKNRTITKIYSNDKLAKTKKGIDGKFVIIELSKNDKSSKINLKKIEEIQIVIEQNKGIEFKNGERHKVLDMTLKNGKVLKIH